MVLIKLIPKFISMCFLYLVIFLFYSVTVVNDIDEISNIKTDLIPEDKLYSVLGCYLFTKQSITGFDLCMLF